MDVEIIDELPPTLGELARRVRLSDSARALLRDELWPHGFFEVLVEEGLYADAIRLLPHLWSKRVAVWWGCLCAWQAHRPDPSSAVATALEAAVAWVLDPSDANRWAARQPAREAGCKTPAGCLARAVFWSGGSLLPPELPCVAPKEHLTARMVSGSVLRAARFGRPAGEARGRQRQFLELGIELSQGRNLWDEAPAALHEVERRPAFASWALLEEPLASIG